MNQVSSALVLLTSAVVSSQLFANASSLNFYTWEDYLSQEVIDEWEAETGIRIHQFYFDDEAQRNLVLSSHAGKNIDLALIDNTSIGVMRGAGHLYPVRQEAEREHFWPTACGRYGRQYMWGSFGLVYRSDKLETPPSSWKDIMYPSVSLQGHIGMLGQADELLMPALVSLGYSLDTTNQNELKEAFALLKQQSPSVFTYDYIYTFVSNQPESDNVWVAPAYSGDQDGLNELQGEGLWKYSIPKEGAVIWVDCLAITQDSRKKEEAQAFIDFLSRKEISARNSESLWTATPFKDALPFIDSELIKDETTYLDSETLAGSMLFPVFRGSDILKRTRIKDALIRYHDSN